MHVLVSSAVASLFVFACSSSSKPATTEATDLGTSTSGGAGAGSGASDASHTACSADEDCVVVETACCDHCNGGKAEAFNKEHAAAHTPTGCEQTMCTKMACGPVTASCQAGVCTAVQQPL